MGFIRCKLTLSAHEIYQEFRGAIRFNLHPQLWKKERKSPGLFPDLSRFPFLSGPSSPRNVQALPLSTSAIQVKWQPPDDPNGGIIKYIIEYQPVDQGSPHPWVDTDDGVKTAKNVTALNSSTVYQFRVRAFSKVPGEWSNFVQAKTQGDGEDGGPQRPQ